MSEMSPCSPRKTFRVIERSAVRQMPVSHVPAWLTFACIAVAFFIPFVAYLFWIAH